MEYLAEVLNRSTGDLEQVSLGNWITVTEYGKSKGVGRNTTRAVLARLGLLAEERSGNMTRWRLTQEAIRKGWGKRHDRPLRGKYPFDVLSPSGQSWIEDRWEEALAAHRRAGTSTPAAARAQDALRSFKARRTELTIQMEVCWLLDHFSDLTAVEIGHIIGSPKQTVADYVAIRADCLRELRARVSQMPTSLRPGSRGLAKR